VTADRPRRLRGTGAPQTIDQPPLFAAAGAAQADIDAPGQLSDLPSGDGPVHINVCFDEPLVDAEPATIARGPAVAARSTRAWMEEKQARAACDDFFGRMKNPLVLVSSLDETGAQQLAPWLASLSCPLYLEAVSQLRDHLNLQEFSLRSGERILLTPECAHACDGILRIGGVPTPRFWRECDSTDKLVLHVSAANFTGTARPDPVVPLSLFTEISGDYAPPGGNISALLARDRAAAERLEKLISEEPGSEAAMVRALDENISDNARVFLGNSLPIREWDLCATRATRARSYFANRGVNGIDGLVSTALGLCGNNRPTVAVMGDLSALYDLPGLWPAEQLADPDITLAVINNGGGMIFERMFRHPGFRNAHGIRLRGWAEMFGWHYGTVRGGEEIWPQGQPRILELLPDPGATARFAEVYAELWP
jgi:2-succinyl-5-enolpyruvyl-6-hydroxy-3-cyclohexene-1-carboxylate synthase